MGVKCFMVHETGTFRSYLRRFTYSSNSTCSASHYNSGHDALGPSIGVISVSKGEDGYYRPYLVTKDILPPNDDPRWPVKCESCDYQFTEKDQYKISTDQIWKGDDGKEYFLRKPVPGMMWYSSCAGESELGPDGHCLVVVCPDGGLWTIDGHASNCTEPNDRGPFKYHHRCWCRHGTPPNVTVDKIGNTCKAGGGSIISPNGKYHGFLKNGEFT
jgi:hypothetical protein